MPFRLRLLFMNNFLVENVCKPEYQVIIILIAGPVISRIIRVKLVVEYSRTYFHHGISISEIYP